MVFFAQILANNFWTAIYDLRSFFHFLVSHLELVASRDLLVSLIFLSSKSG